MRTQSNNSDQIAGFALNTTDRSIGEAPVDEGSRDKKGQSGESGWDRGIVVVEPQPNRRATVGA